MEKTCFLCKEKKPFADFYKKLSAKDGLHTYCIKCYSILNKIRYEKNKEKRLEYAKKYRENNAVHIKQYRDDNKEKARKENKKYRILHKNELSKKSAEYRSKNREFFSKLTKEWRMKNPHKIVEIAARKRLLTKRATPSWANKFFINEIYDLARKRSEITGGEWHVDHIVPINSKIVCGLHCECNLAVIPAKVNLSKSNRVWPDMP